jgi:hypothetical protein
MIRYLLLASLTLAPTVPHVAASDPIRVPRGGSTPVLLDGQLSPGEWDDALAVPMDGSMRLLLKQVEGHVFLAVATGTRVPRPVDVYLQDDAGRIHQLHASAQIGERLLADTLWAVTEPAWRWGNHVDWIANEAKADGTQPPERALSERLFPADGTEYQIRRARFPGSRWRVRVEVASFSNEGVHIFPADASRDPATWAVVELE